MAQGFHFESLHAIRIGAERRRNDFDGHITPEACVSRAIHLAHAARPEERHDFKCAETNAGRE